MCWRLIVLLQTMMVVSDAFQQWCIIADESPGEVSEWLMVADSKSVLGLHLTEVRILSSP
jgi:hypothetical protein